MRHFLETCWQESWTLEPAKGDKRYVGYVREMLFEDLETPLAEVCQRAARYRFTGFSLQEWTAKLKNGRFTLKTISARPAESIAYWQLDEAGNLVSVTQRLQFSGKEVVIPAEKLLHLADNFMTESPAGRGVLRDLRKTAELYTYYLGLEKDMFIGDTRGIPIGYAPIGEMGDDVSALKPMMDFLNDHERSENLSMLLDSSTYISTDESGKPSTNKKWSVELLRGGTTSQSPLYATIERLQHEMARVLGIENMLLGSGSSGSFALADNKSESFYGVAAMAMCLFAGNLRTQVLGPLFDANGWPREKMPFLRPGDQKRKDPAALADIILKLSQARQVDRREDPAFNDIRRRAGLPEGLGDTPEPPTAAPQAPARGPGKE
jgi:hypothetical protein